MRIILKPAGLAVLLAALSVLAFLAFRSLPRPAQDASAAVPPPTAAATTADPSRRDLLDGSGVGKFTMPTPDHGSMSLIAAEGRPGGHQQAARVTIKAARKDYWEVQIGRATPVAVTAKQPLTLSFWARSKTKNRMAAVFEKNSEPFDKALLREVVLTPEWKEYRFDFTTPAYAAEKSGVRFQMGFAPGTVEIAGVRLETPRK